MDKQSCGPEDFDEVREISQQDNILDDYQRRYKLTDEDAANLRMSFSPNEVALGLSFYETRFYIDRYKYQKEIELMKKFNVLD